jgi:hypothetical protein
VSGTEWRCYFPDQFNNRRIEASYRAMAAILFVRAELAQADNTEAR